MDTPEPFIGRWPGKSPNFAGGIPHPAAYHMLDVAAVAERLLRQSSLPKPLQDALILLVAMHDLGKIGAEFRDMLLNGKRQGKRHWEVTEALLRHHDEMLGEAIGGEPRLRYGLYAAAAGHHGRPPDCDSREFSRMQSACGAEALNDTGTFAAACLPLWPSASLNTINGLQATALTWWLPGLVAAADWVGSNPEWFPAVPPAVPIAAYWTLARGRAQHAVQLAGLEGCGVSAKRLFCFDLRPMQQAALDVPMREGPMLAIIEDETGAGKTEAALLLAQRMMLAGKGRGLFFALPTMATSDAMFVRASSIVGRMFETAPSVTLAHGRAGVSEDFLDVVGRPAQNDDDITCAPWLADGRRRALLADVGVGTIDQSLLAVLPTKFSTLRLFGLASKILIVDEVHEVGDPYMATELAQLLRALTLADRATAAGSAPETFCSL
jgi:CRISPR-associated endonuclease/helicase Cas3